MEQIAQRLRILYHVELHCSTISSFLIYRGTALWQQKSSLRIIWLRQHMFLFAILKVYDYTLVTDILTHPYKIASVQILLGNRDFFRWKHCAMAKDIFICYIAFTKHCTKASNSFPQNIARINDCNMTSHFMHCTRALNSFTQNIACFKHCTIVT